MDRIDFSTYLLDELFDLAKKQQNKIQKLKEHLDHEQQILIQIHMEISKRKKLPR